jgi:hypothetical protein
MIVSLLFALTAAAAAANQPVWETTITLPTEKAVAYGVALDGIDRDYDTPRNSLPEIIRRFGLHVDRIDVLDAAGVAMPRGGNPYANGYPLWFEARGTPPYHLRLGPKSVRGDHDSPAPPLRVQMDRIRDQRTAMFANGKRPNVSDLPTLVLPMVRTGMLYAAGSVVEEPPPDPRAAMHEENALVLRIACAATLLLVLLAALDARLRRVRKP